MILLLIAALAAIALVVVFGWKLSRTRARQRQERLAGARRAAAAEAQAGAWEDEERRRAWDDADDALTSVLPAIKLPWPTQLPSDPGNGYRDLEGEYPQFSAVTPFGANPRHNPGPAGHPDPYEQGPYEQAPYEPVAYEPEPEPRDQEPLGTAARERGPFEPVVPRPDEFRLPRRGQDDRMVPLPRADEPVPTGAFPGEHLTAADRARKRAAHGNHRGGHAKRRRG